METTIAAGVGRGLGRIPSARLGTPSLCRGAFISALRQAPRVAEEIRLAKAKRCRPNHVSRAEFVQRRRMLGQSLAWGISLIALPNSSYSRSNKHLFLDARTRPAASPGVGSESYAGTFYGD
jgi:hypothetical protein